MSNDRALSCGQAVENEDFCKAHREKAGLRWNPKLKSESRL
jgi:hypothetical protein